MNEPLYRHVLFKDLVPYLRREDYLEGFTSTELAWIRKNIGAASVSDIKALVGAGYEYTYLELLQIVKSKTLNVGTFYLIKDFQSIYLSNVKNEYNKYISWGGEINPSEVYSLLVLAIQKDALFPYVTVFSTDSNSINWSVRYDINQETLDDGITTKGKITFMVDENYNLAQYDFKNKLFYVNGELKKTFNSDNNYNNNLLFSNNIIFNADAKNNIVYGNNVVFNTAITNFVGTLNNVKVEGIDLDNSTQKTSILLDNVYYIDYLDLETLTHLFYALSNSIFNSQ